MKYAVLVPVLLCAGTVRLVADARSCESSPAVNAARRDLAQKLSGATFQQSIALEDQADQQIMQLDPADYRPVREYQDFVRYQMPERWIALRSQFVAKAKAHPEEPVNLVAAALALLGTDTPQSIAFLNQATKTNPDYAAAYLELTAYYHHLGKFTDKTKAAGFLEKYYQLCPSGRDGWATNYLKQLGSNELKVQVAKNLRARLATLSDPHELQWYSDVWSLEFAALPVTEHPKERQRVAEDLNRLEKLPVPASPEWLNFLKDGYKQSGAPDNQVKALEARISKEFPRSDEAFEIWYQDWNDQHPRPAGEASAAEWQQYMRLALAHDREIAQLFPNEHGFGYSTVEYTSHLDATSSDEIARAGEAYLKESDLYQGSSSGSRQYVAGVFLDHNVEPARALALLQQARTLKESPREKAFSETADYAKPKAIEDSAERRVIGDAEFRVLYLRACRAAGDKSAAEELKASVEAEPPAYAKALPAYWDARAILADIEGHDTDALAFYQKTLFLREPPQKRYGVFNDTLLADARRVWIASQGSEAAFAIWSQPGTASNPVLAEGRWEKPDKELPSFELADLQGKTWKLTQLEGRKVLINIWATWCGPCQAELPHLEKLYEKTKDRSDITILTLNFDDDIGMIEPFVKKKGYTFPVLPAYAFLANKIDVNSIPRNWLINANGKWQWEQIGFDSGESDWEKSMLSRLEGTN
jgi:thiol-disulfide isomerase/thioredoxin